MAERVDLSEFVGGFVVEAAELVALARTSLLEIEAGHREGATRPKAVRELFRALHTIKGLAGMIGVEPIVEIAHAVETLVRAADRAGGRLRRSGVDACLRGVVAIEERVKAVSAGRTPAPPPVALLDALSAEDAAREPEAPPPPMSTEWDARLGPGERKHLFDALRAGHPAWSFSFTPSDDKAAAGTTIATVRARISEIGEIIKVVPRALPAGGVVFDILAIANVEAGAIAAIAVTDDVTALVAPAELLEAAPVEEDELEPAGSQRSVVRVDLDRLDELQEQLSALIVSRFRLERELAVLAERGVQVRTLRELAEVQARQLRELRRAILRVRLVRVDEVLEPLALIARSASRSGHTEVALHIDSGGSELDKAVADRLMPAIVHLVRNAIDHGIEPAEERARAGKPRSGTVHIICREHAGAQLTIEIADDGRGIDRDAVARRSRRALVDDQALLDVLTTPGFTTRDVATTTSGRGVGMDVVKRIVSELGGELSLETRREVGTTFMLRVPLTIAIVEALAFECGRQTFVAPVASVDEIIELSNEVTPGAGGTVSLVQRRGRSLSVVSLGALLAIDDGARARKALVLRRAGDPLAFSVDRMLGRHEVVLRPIIDPLARVPGVAGSTDLGDGRPTLVLDLPELGLLLASRERGV